MSDRKILLVEDNEDNRLVYRTILDHFGFTVLEAADGEEGMRRARIVDRQRFEALASAE